MNTIQKTSVITALVTAALAPPTVGLVKHWEGTEFVPYRDIGGIWTVCEGITGAAVIPNKVYTRHECRDLLNGELQHHAQGLAACLSKMPQVPPQPVLTAWISWTYNVGVKAACGSSLVFLANQGKFEEACHQLPRWNKVKGKITRGLVNRREAELTWCLHGLGLADAPSPVVVPKVAT